METLNIALVDRDDRTSPAASPPGGGVSREESSEAATSTRNSRGRKRKRVSKTYCVVLGKIYTP